MNLIRFEKVSHYYNGKPALKDLNFEIEDKKITAIIGKSGSGKSTLLQTINGLIKPSQGRVIVFGEKLDYSRLVELRRKIGYSVQGTGLFPHMTIYKNIALPGEISGNLKHNTERRVDTLMSFVNLPPSFKTKYPYQLSGGEQQRVGICRAMLLEPPIFLLDEAFGALDADTKKGIHMELLELQHAEPRTIVLVTHDLNEALRLCDNMMIINEGIVQQYGAKNEVISNPANDFVSSFIEAHRN
jgi:osmoprotectant transport system ATP-binding protein